MGLADHDLHLAVVLLAISVMFTAMFSAASIVWDREFGFLRARAPQFDRDRQVSGRGHRRLHPGVIMILLAGLVHVPYDPVLILGIFGLQLLLTYTITAFG